MGCSIQEVTITGHHQSYQQLEITIAAHIHKNHQKHNKEEGHIETMCHHLEAGLVVMWGQVEHLKDRGITGHQ